MRVEPGSFRSKVGALPTVLFENMSNMEYFFKIKIENMLYGLRANFYIVFHRNSQQTSKSLHLSNILIRLNSPVPFKPLILFLIQEFAMISEFFP